MIKSYNLYNTILYQSTPGPELSERVDTDREYLNAVFDIRTNARWMSSLAQNPLAARFILECPAIVGLFVDNKDVVDNILLAEDNYAAYLPVAAASPAAVLSIAGSYMYTKIHSDAKYSDLYTPGSAATVIKALSLILHLPGLPSTHTTFADIIADLDLMQRIAANTQAVVALVTSNEGLQAAMSNTAAMEIFVTSQAAFNVIASIPEARSAVINSPDAMAVAVANGYAVYALVNVWPYVDVFDAPGNLALIANSDAALSGVWESKNAVSSVFKNTGYLTQLVARDSALTSLMESVSAMEAVVGDQAALSRIFTSARFKLALFESEQAVTVFSEFYSMQQNSVNLVALTKSINQFYQVQPSIAPSTSPVYSGKAFILQILGTSAGQITLYTPDNEPIRVTPQAYGFYALENSSASKLSGGVGNVSYIKADVDGVEA